MHIYNFRHTTPLGGVLSGRAISERLNTQNGTAQCSFRSTKSRYGIPGMILNGGGIERMRKKRSDYPGGGLELPQNISKRHSRRCEIGGRQQEICTGSARTIRGFYGGQAQCCLSCMRRMGYKGTTAIFGHRFYRNPPILLHAQHEPCPIERCQKQVEQTSKTEEEDTKALAHKVCFRAVSGRIEDG